MKLSFKTYRGFVLYQQKYEEYMNVESNEIKVRRKRINAAQ